MAFNRINNTNDPAIPFQNDGTVQLLPLSCESASLTVSMGPIPMIIMGKVAQYVFTHIFMDLSLVTEIHANSKGDRTFNQHMPIPRYLTLVAASATHCVFSRQRPQDNGCVSLRDCMVICPRTK